MMGVAETWLEQKSKMEVNGFGRENQERKGK
jgi:hypothetical protein